VVEGAIGPSSGVLGVEGVAPSGCGAAATELEISRGADQPADRERADFFVAAGAAARTAQRQVASRWRSRSGSESDFNGVVDLVHMVAYMHGDDASGHDESVPIPAR